MLCFYLAAEFKPRFEKELETATATEHTSVEFKCVVVGEPRPDIRWFKDGKPISEDGKHKIQSELDGTQILQIIDVTVVDVGKYKVEASNTVGSVFSQADLIVKGQIIVFCIFYFLYPIGVMSRILPCS